MSADAVGSQWLTFRAHYESGSAPDRARRRRCSRRSASSRRCGTTTSPTGRGTSFTAQVDIVPSTPGCSASPAASARTTHATATSACRSRRSARSRSAPTTTSRTASAPARPTTTSAMPDCRRSRRRVPDAPFNDPRATGRPTRTSGQLLLDLRDPAAHRPQHRGAVLLRLQPRARQLSLHVPAGSPMPPPTQLPDVFNKLQQLHLDVRHRLTNRLRRVVLLSLRAVPHLRLRVRPERGQRHRPAELAGHGLRLPSVHRALGRVSVCATSGESHRHEVRSVHARLTTTRMACPCGALAVGARGARGCAAQDADNQEGRAGLRRPEMLDVPRHRRQGQEAEPARRRRAKLSAADIKASGSSRRSK